MRRRDDYRTQASRRAGYEVLALCDADKIVIGLGGGPIRLHPKIHNLNIVAYENVDIVGDAHTLPLANDSVDGVLCEAVFEHLKDPQVAAAEMRRVPKPGGRAFVCTPFLQPFHGYPSHFQNFTQAGHERLFARAGFDVLESGVAVGPAWAISTLVASFIAQYMPGFLRWPLRAVWYVFSNLLVRPMDGWLAVRPDAHIGASTTYVLLMKPASPL